MAWMYNDSVIREGRSWTDDNGIKHPTSWGSWSDEEKIAADLVWVDDPAPYDPRFYWDADTPKALDDVAVLDEDGEPMLDENGNPVVTLGLKSKECASVKTEAGFLLAPTDWYVVRNAETEVAIPATIATFRAAVRTASGTIEAAITAAADLDDFMALYDAPEDGNAPINDWPEEV